VKKVHINNYMKHYLYLPGIVRRVQNKRRGLDALNKLCRKETLKKETKLTNQSAFISYFNRYYHLKQME
jgi:hypothetical protein